MEEIAIQLHRIDNSLLGILVALVCINIAIALKR